VILVGVPDEDGLIADITDNAAEAVLLPTTFVAITLNL
jgi:hypothetical protein